LLHTSQRHNAHNPHETDIDTKLPLCVPMLSHRNHRAAWPVKGGFAKPTFSGVPEYRILRSIPKKMCVTTRASPWDCGENQPPYLFGPTGQPFGRSFGPLARSNDIVSPESPGRCPRCYTQVRGTTPTIHTRLILTQGCHYASPCFRIATTMPPGLSRAVLLSPRSLECLNTVSYAQYRKRCV
jgi:hypothetical protein